MASHRQGPTIAVSDKPRLRTVIRQVARQRGDSEGPWQQLPDRYLLANQWGLPHLDAQGLTFYLPPVMRFAVRHLRRPHPDDGWLSESLGFTLQRPSHPLRPTRVGVWRVCLRPSGLPLQDFVV